VADDKDPPESEGQAPTMDDVRDLINDALAPIKEMIAGIGKPAPPPNPDQNGGKSGGGGSDAGLADNLTAMVDSAIGKALGKARQDDAEAEHRAHHERLAAAERQPVDRPRRSKWLGNIFDKD
jgi:hypothetical protein